MKPALLACLLFLLAAVTGCGEQAAVEAGETASSTSVSTTTSSTTEPSSTTGAPPDGDTPTHRQKSIDYEVVEQLYGSAVGGSAGEGPVVLDTPESISSFVSQFTAPGFAQKVGAAARKAHVPDGFTLVGAVTFVGCGEPDGAAVERTHTGLVVVPTGLPQGDITCVAAVTTVVLVAVESEAVS